MTERGGASEGKEPNLDEWLGREFDQNFDHLRHAEQHISTMVQLFITGYPFGLARS